MPDLDSDEQAIVDVVRDFVDSEVRPVVRGLEHADTYPEKLIEQMKAMGVFGLAIPRPYGEVQVSAVCYALVTEQLARGWMSLAGAMGGHTVVAKLLVDYGTDEQKQRYLPRWASGEWIAAYALTEPGAGSDAAALATRAAREGEEWVLDGVKRFITNAGVAHTYIVFARSEEGICAFVVEADDPGFGIGRIEPKMGIKGSTTGELLLDSCRIPADRLVGREGEGFRLAMRVLDRSRPGIAAQALGIGQAALDYAARYATERVAFGKPISDQQGIQFMLADMATSLEAARGLVHRVGAMLDAGVEGPELTKFSAMCKLAASDAAMRVTTDAVQILGGYGYIQEFPVERMMRDAKITQIYEGTNQIQRIVIARELLRGL